MIPKKTMSGKLPSMIFPASGLYYFSILPILLLYVRRRSLTFIEDTKNLKNSKQKSLWQALIRFIPTKHGLKQKEFSRALRAKWPQTTMGVFLTHSAFMTQKKA